MGKGLENGLETYLYTTVLSGLVAITPTTPKVLT